MLKVLLVLRWLQIFSKDSLSAAVHLLVIQLGGPWVTVRAQGQVPGACPCGFLAKEGAADE